MRIMFRYLALLLPLVMGVSCVEDIDLDTREDRLVTVNCILGNDSIQKLYLTYSHPKDPQLIIPIIDAKVSLSCGGNKIGDFEHLGSGEYLLEYIPVCGEVYLLEVEVENEEKIFAKTVFPLKHEVKSVENYPGTLLYDYLNPLPELQNINIFTGIGLDIRCEQDCLLWLYVMKTSDGNSKREAAKFLASDHRNLDSFNASDSTIRYYRVDKKGNRPEKFYTEIMSGWQMCTVQEWQKIETRTDYPLQYCYLRIEHPKNYVQYLDYVKMGIEYNSGVAIDSTRLFRIAGTFDQSHADLVSMNVSAEYDKYIRTCMQVTLNKMVDNFNYIYKTDNVYSNIENGTGIFGAAYTIEVKDFANHIFRF